ncbi:hypothetical protein HPP92_012203 [Vanilla planifolia]|uniref:Uncharacterized protein n=1 Tax=Vanilla planifolia TaxID=51239 RepID=A0A835V2I8_VANPL|nr:hypothetical protein HPP92_012203 [Vanilla planifolia]
MIEQLDKKSYFSSKESSPDLSPSMIIGGNDLPKPLERLKDPDCPYISDSDIGNNCTGESNYAALTENNKKIHMEVLQQKRKLEMLIGKIFVDMGLHDDSINMLSDEEGDAYPNVVINEDVHPHGLKALNSHTIDEELIKA